jgi:hypothetical protein
MQESRGWRWVTQTPRLGERPQGDHRQARVRRSDNTDGPQVCAARRAIRSGQRPGTELGILGPQDFDTWAEFSGRLLLRLPAPTSADTGLTSHFGVARPVTPMTGLRRSGWRRSVDHDRRSLRELGQNLIIRFGRCHAPWRSEAEPHWRARLGNPGAAILHRDLIPAARSGAFWSTGWRGLRPRSGPR